MTGHAHAGRCGGHWGAWGEPTIWYFSARGGRHGRARGPGGGPFGYGEFGRGPRARRGDVRAALLVLLDDAPRNGYQLMQEIEERSGGAWRPSPGSVYPALAQLEDEGLIRSEEHEGRRRFALTDEGRAHVEERREQLGTPWEDLAGGAPGDLRDLRGQLGEIAMAMHQIVKTGTAEQLEQARTALADARRALYRILAGDADA